MALLVTGSIGIDTVTTPYGTSKNCLGGSAVYFSMAASFFAPVRLIGAVGVDCPFDLKTVFAERDVDLTGLEVRPMSKTFRWVGSYHGTMDIAVTEGVELNVLSEKPPKIPPEFKDSGYIFLANTAPVLQNELLDQLYTPNFVAADTMNCWIQGHFHELERLLKRINCLIINEDEARALASESNLIKAIDKILTMGPSVIVVKKGESGSIASDSKGQKFILPAYPSAEVKDPTGAGDSFAGALMGYLAKTRKTDFDVIKMAVAYGTVAASFTISDFSLQALAAITNKDIEERVQKLKKMVEF